jgi:hypothetical protein
VDGFANVFDLTRREALGCALMHKVFAFVASFLIGCPTLVAQPSAVGFVDVQVPPGYSVFANPLFALDHTIAALFPAAKLPEGATLYTLTEEAGPGLSVEQENSLRMDFIGRLPGELGAPIQIALSGNRISLEWSGNLETANQIFGPFETPAQTIRSLLIPERDSFRFWRARVAAPFNFPQFKANVWSGGVWSDPAQILNPGQGFIFYNPGAGPFTVTFLGVIPQGRLSNAIPAGWSIRCAMFPASGGISRRTKLELTPGDHIFFWEAGTFRQYTFLGGQSWFPEEPESRAARAFFVFANKAVLWEADFSLFE